MAGGEFRAGSLVAARFDNWRVTVPREVLGSDVTCIDIESVTVVDTFHVEHSILDIWLDCDTAWWVWRQVKPEDGAWHTRGGPPEIRVK